MLYQDAGIIGHFSKKLSDPQIWYSVTEKQLLAIYLAVKYGRQWLRGSRIEVYTDNKNILGVDFNFDKKTNLWKEEQAEYNIQYNHIKGTDNCVADSLFALTNGKIHLSNLSLEPNQADRIRKVNQYHIEHGHPGIEATYKTINLTQKNLKIKKDILKEVINACDFSQRNKHGKRYEITYGNPSKLRLFEDICSDVYGPFKGSKYMHNLDTNKL